MRWKIIEGKDISNIKSAIFYGRYQAPVKKYTKWIDEKGNSHYEISPFLRKPLRNSLIVRSDKNDLMSFLEYEFKYKVDKGMLSTFTVQNYLNENTNNELLYGKDNLIESTSGLEIANNSLVFQIGGDYGRNYNYVTIVSLGNSSELILDAGGDLIYRNDDGSYKYKLISDGVDEDGNLVSSSTEILDKLYGVQRIELYDDIILNKNSISHEYIDGDDIEDPLEVNDRVPTMVIEFGPEISLEREDYYNKYEYETVLSNNIFSSEYTRDDYNNELDELSNRKLIVVSISDKSNVTVNLSLSAHNKELDPHRNQDNIVLSNEYWLSKNYDKSLFESQTGDQSSKSILLDKRSNTLLGTIRIERSEFIIFNELVNRCSVTKIVRYGILSGSDKIVRIPDNTSPDLIERITETIELSYYKPEVVYKQGNRVLYNSIDYKSLIDGNIGEIPSISPYWSEYLIEDDEDSQEGKTTLFINNISDDGCLLNSSDIDGEIEVTDDIDIISNPIKGYKVYKVELNGVEITIDDSVIHIQKDSLKKNIQNSLIISYDKISVSLTIIGDNEDIIVNKKNEYFYGDKVSLSAKVLNDKFEFLGYYDSTGDNILSNSLLYNFIIKEDTRISFKSRIKRFNISVFGDNSSYSYINTVEYGGTINIDIRSDNGYVIERIIDNGYMNYIDYLTRYSLKISNITSNHKIEVVSCNNGNLEYIQNIGNVKYSIIGDQEWTSREIYYLSKILTPKYNQSFKYLKPYYSLSDIDVLDNSLKTKIDSKGFRIPISSDIDSLIRYVGDNGAEKLKSNIDKTDKILGWESKGNSDYGFDAVPYGEYNSSTDEFIGVGSSFKIPTYQDGSTISRLVASISDESSEIEKVSDSTFISFYPIRLCRDIPKISILGKEYPYRKYGDKEWIVLSLSYDDLGEYYEKYDYGFSDLSGKLYSSEEMIEINNLLSEESHGFHIPTDEDWMNLEKFIGISNKYQLDDLGYRGTTEGKSLKYDFIVQDESIGSSYQWNGYSLTDTSNRRFDLIPDGYFNGLNGLFEGIGLKSKVWSSTNDVFSKDKYLIRELSSDSNKIGRSMSNIGDKLLIRLVR